MATDPFPTGPFYIQGSIYKDRTLDPDGTVPIGAQAEGTSGAGGIYDGAAGAGVVFQAFEFTGAGDIQLQGTRTPSARSSAGRATSWEPPGSAGSK